MLCLFILDPVGPMIQQNVHEKYIFDTDSSKSRHTITQPCVAHRPKVTPGQPDHLSTRGPVSWHDVRPHTTNKLLNDAPTTGRNTHDP